MIIFKSKSIFIRKEKIIGHRIDSFDRYRIKVDYSAAEGRRKVSRWNNRDNAG